MKKSQQILCEGMVKATIISILTLYLAVPLKQQVFNGIHLICHIASYENPHHSHDDHEPGSNHHHNFLEFLDQTLDDPQSDHPFPIVLTNYQIQPHLPTQNLHLIDNFAFLLKNMFLFSDIQVLAGLIFEVPTPPP